LLSAAAGGGALAGATVVFVTVPRPPGLGAVRRFRPVSARLTAGLEQAALAARCHGAARVIVLSTAFVYDDDLGVPLCPGAPTVTAAETSAATAAEQAARLFTGIGGDAVVLRLGWTCGPAESITRRVLAAARRGWRLIDGDPGACVAMVAEQDAARAVESALTAAPGTYDVTDGWPITQCALNTRIEAAVGRLLHSLDDSRWGECGILFGPSRRITSTAFTTLTGWSPRLTPAVDGLAAMLR
jgi:nucleoside-diphosphate-sugar epimerase